MRYTPKYFRDTMPEWKRKKDPPLSRLFYRPAGYVLAAVCANHGISANTVSYFSVVIAIVSCILFLFPSYPCRFLSAILINFWTVLDATDGCIARSVKSEPFGDFADGISSYILVALMGSTMGVAVYHEGGLLVPSGIVWMVLVGALASTADTLMRLVYQKFRATERAEAEKGRITIEHDIRTDHDQVKSLRVKIEQDLGIGGILPAMILLGTIFHALDIVVFYCFAYYGLSCIVITCSYIRKAIKVAKENG